MRRSSIPTQATLVVPKFTAEDLSLDNRYFYIAHTMKKSNMPVWGLPIFRTTYADDDLWISYLQTLYDGTHNSLRNAKQQILTPHFFCHVFEDASLDGASKETIRERFAQWVTETAGERVKPDSKGVVYDEIPQDFACLIVDDYCIKIFAEIQNHQDQWIKESAPIIVFFKDWDIDYYRGQHRSEWTDGEIHKEVDEFDDPEELCIPDEKDLIFFEEVDGLRAPVLGWMYAKIGSMADLYNDLGEGRGTREVWYRAYARPPRVFPDQDDDEWKL
ncbi:hypothetical protein N7494_008022 [Penicillium frequentans]|uniref:Uncharacterized protein n=1 Tax=Penicillium frequentans TaxID=3151616 RepID=A0AAD6GD96_9EURO|nr:hypothetical protein N7494_008022 [Penicillium glabrum]